MARPRSDGPRYPCGRLRPAKPPASVAEIEQQAAERQENNDIDADLLAISQVMSSRAFYEWLDAGCDLEALPREVQRHVQRRRQLRADERMWARRQRKLIEEAKQLAGTYATA